MQLPDSTPPTTCLSSRLRHMRREHPAPHCQSLGLSSTRSGMQFLPNATCKMRRRWGRMPRKPVSHEPAGAATACRSATVCMLDCFRDAAACPHAPHLNTATSSGSRIRTRAARAAPFWRLCSWIVLIPSGPHLLLDVVNPNRRCRLAVPGCRRVDELARIRPSRNTRDWPRVRSFFREAGVGEPIESQNPPRKAGLHIRPRPGKHEIWRSRASLKRGFRKPLLVCYR